MVYLVVVIYPSLAGAVYAFTDWSGIGGAPNWVGLDNFKRLFTDDQSFGALRNTVLLTIFIVIVQNAVGLALALGVHAQIKSRYVLRAIFFAPAVHRARGDRVPVEVPPQPRAPTAASTPCSGSSASDFLQQDWLGDPSLALWSVGFTVVWQYAGYSMVIFLAGLQGVPRELEEAAALDGAGRWKRFRHVVLPLIAPAMTINLMLSTIGGLKLFDQVFAITRRRPGLLHRDALDADLQAGVRVRQLRLLDRGRARARAARRRPVAGPAQVPAQPRGGGMSFRYGRRTFGSSWG